MNSVLRSVDLSTEVLSPVLVGFVMSWAGMVAGGVVIAVWNVTSLIVEYGMLRNLYANVTALRNKESLYPGIACSDASVARPHFRFLERVRMRAADAASAWSLYFKHGVRMAGLALAFLFMTVLALDNYSRAYVVESGVSKAVLGILTAAASLFGILASVAFPILRRKIGVLSTGVLGFTFECACLTLCVASVFASGSAFDPACTFASTSDLACGSMNQNNYSFVPPERQYNSEDARNESQFSFKNQSVELDVEEGANGNQTESHTYSSEGSSHLSVSLLLAGIIVSRFGLWLADLTVTQILQEEVHESERGAINGVQSSLNQSLSLLRSLLLVLLPTMKTFGILILLSFVFVSIATGFFYVFAFKKRKVYESTPQEEHLHVAELTKD